MSDPMLNQVQTMLTDLSQDIDKMAGAMKAQVDAVMAAMDDVAAHTLAVQAILVNMLKKVEVNPDEVQAWIREQTKAVDASGAGAAKALALADYLVTGRRD